MLLPGEVVRFKKPMTSNDSRTWTPARVQKPPGVRPFINECEGLMYRRNRRELRATPEHYSDAAWYRQHYKPERTMRQQQWSDNTGVNNHGAQQRGLGSAPSLAPPPQGVPPIVMSPPRSVPSTAVQLPRNVPPSVSQTARSVPVTVLRSGRPVNLLVKFRYYKIKLKSKHVTL